MFLTKLIASSSIELPLAVSAAGSSSDGEVNHTTKYCLSWRFAFHFVHHKLEFKGLQAHFKSEKIFAKHSSAGPRQG